VLERPELLATRFDRYLETLASECGYMMAAARGQLDAGFERIAEPLVGRGALDLKSFDALTLALDHAARDARNLNELFAAYRTAVMDMAQAVERPVDARLEQRLRRAVGYIRSHYSEPLSSAAVAKLVGLTRTHFSKLFKIHEQKTFVEYVSDLRLARARQLLDDTELEVARIAELAGFRSAQYFSRVFRRAHGRTPLEQRARSRRQRDRRAASQKVNLK
jgi:transcriptional regulator GlxA family with amidase domain